MLGAKLVAVDIDDDRVVDAIKNALPYTPIRKRGRVGETLIYRTPETPLTNAAWNIDQGRAVDLLATRRQTVLPPSIHPITQEPFLWIGEQALEDADENDIPFAPLDISDKIDAAIRRFGAKRLGGVKPEERDIKISNDAPEARELNDKAFSELDAWAPNIGLYNLKKVGPNYHAVAQWRDSSSGRDLDKRGQNLHITPDGAVDWGVAAKVTQPSI